MNQKSKLNIVALIFTMVMIISCFLPWAEVNSRSSVMGYTSSYSSSVSGIQSGVGFIGIVLGIACMVLVIIKNRLMAIPGIFCVIFSFFQASSMEDMASNVTTSYGEGHAGPSFGIYLLLLSSVLFVLFTIRNLWKKQLPEIAVIENEEVEQNALPKAEVKKKILITKSLILKVVTGVVLIIAGTGIYFWIDQVQTENKELFEREKYRMDDNTGQVVQLIENKQYVDALQAANLISWQYEKESNLKLSQEYDRIRDSLIKVINTLRIIEAESLTMELSNFNQDIYVNKDSIYDESETEPPSFPFEMVVVVDKAYLYTEPDNNSERINFVTKNSVVIVMANQYDFMYCKSKNADSTNLVGWIYSKDISKIEL